ncbi:MAG: hypothetical protein JNN08_32265 [Bryobacterales bacterium]|nr:hypothetical protein [Bryobacterales bacterium]
MTESFFARELPGETPLGRQTAERLCKAAASLRLLKPWSWMSEDQLVLVRDDGGQVHSASVMGAVGEFEAVAVYVGAAGQRFFEKAHGAPDLDLFLGEQHGIRVEFASRAELDPSDRELLRQLAPEMMKGRGKVPIFRTVRPGYLAWYPTEEEGSLLARGLEAVALIAGHRERVTWDGGRYPLVDWKDGDMVLSTGVPTRAAEVLPMPDLDQTRVKRAKSLPADGGMLIVDHFYAPTGIGKKNSRKAAFRAAVALDGGSGIALAPVVAPPEESTANLLAEVTLKGIETTKGRPEIVIVRSHDFESMLKPLARGLGFKLQVIAEIPPLEEFKALMLEHMTRG